MENKFYEAIGENLFSATLPNGLQLRIVPKPGYNTSFAAFATNYGGAFRRFKINGQWIDTPAGVAHFLEHKMFDMPDGDNALSILSANGADPNAFTSSGMTCYYFESTRDFMKNLEMLLKFVSTPYFTPESVQKEQGIIGQEIRMTEDSPGFAVYINLMKLLYKNNPIRDAVAGTVESIAEITDETLYHCHRVFYNPSNMTLCIAGDVDPEEILALAERVLPSEAGEIPEIDFGEPESDFPTETVKDVKMEVSAPQFLIGAKVRPAQNGEALLRQKLVSQLSLRLLVGSSSRFYTELYAAGKLNRDFDYEVDYSAGTATVIIGGESPEPFEVLERLKEEVAKIGQAGLDDGAFSRAKRASFGARLRGLEDFDSVCVSLVDGVFGGYDSLDSYGVLPTIEKSECEEFIRENLSAEKLCVSVISPERS